MDEEERQRRATELRERLAHGRTGTSDGDGETVDRAGEDPSRDDRAPDPEARTDVQDIRRPAPDTSPVGRNAQAPAGRYRGDQPGFGRRDRGSRPGRDRRGEGDIRPADDSAASFGGAVEGASRASVGRLEADGEVIRIGKPEPSFDVSRQADGSFPELSRFREDYKEG